MSKTWVRYFLFGFLSALLLGGGYAYYQYRDYLKEKAAFNAKIKDLETQVEEQLDAALYWQEQSEQHEANANDLQAAGEHIMKLYEGILAERNQLLNQVAIIPPDEVVVQTASFLGVVPTRDIYLNTSGIQFTLDTGRKNLSALTEFYLIERPAHMKLKEAYDTQSAENGELRLSLGACKESNEELKGTVGSLKLEVGDYKAQLAKCEKRVKFSLGLNVPTVAVGVGGFVLGVVIYSLVHR